MYFYLSFIFIVRFWFNGKPILSVLTKFNGIIGIRQKKMNIVTYTTFFFYDLTFDFLVLTHPST